MKPNGIPTGSHFKQERNENKMMKKSSVVVISIMGTVGGLLLAVGMCMCLLPEWNAFLPGVLLSAIGLVTLAAIWPAWRKASGKGALHLTGLHAASLLLGLVGALALGIGLVNCLQTVTSFGLAVGIVGLVLLFLAFLAARKAAGKSTIPFHGQRVLACGIGIAGALLLGVGMCLTMVWGSSWLIPGIVVGCAGLLVCVLNMALRMVKTA